MSRTRICFGLQLLWLAAACDSGGLDSHRVPTDGVPAKLAFKAPLPSAVIAGIPIPPIEVTVQDQHGATVTDARTSVTLALGNNPGPATLTFLDGGTVPAVNGVATFAYVSLDTSGSGYTLVAEATGLNGATSNPFKVTFPPSELVFQVQPTATTPGEAIAPAVRVAVQDIEGYTVESVGMGVTLAIEPNPAGGTLGGNVTAAMKDGVASFPNLVIDKPGKGYALTASPRFDPDGGNPYGLVLKSVTSRPFDVVTYSISGQLSGAVLDGVLISLIGTTTTTTTTAGGGFYSFSGLSNGSYTLIPYLAGANFTPGAITVTVNDADVTGQNFVIPFNPACSADIWARVSSPVSNTSIGLYGVWGSGASDVWAVGGFDDGWDYDKSSLVQHWNGSAWSEVSGGTTLSLLATWGTGANDVWVVGEAGTILRWSGTAWSSVSSDTTAWLYGVWGSGTNDVWVVGEAGTILHWNGTAWSSVPSGTTNGLIGVWGTGANDVWAVGDSGTILRWNGVAWSSVPSGTTDWLGSVWGSGASDVWAVGYPGTILRWTGSAWSSVPSDTTNALFSVWGSGASDVWAVGANGTILHWNGSAWSCVLSGTTDWLFGVWGSAANDVWAVGWPGTLLGRRY